MKSQDLKKLKIPDKSGVYFFIKNKFSSRQGLAERILYIGKATSLRDRVRSYFGKDLINTRGSAILDMVTQANDLEWQETDNVLEALILEANLIKKYQPKYNTKEKDNKSFNYVCITKGGIQSHPDKGDLGGLPKVLIVRGRNLEKEKYDSIFGPFPNGSQLKEATKIIRRIFPYLDNDSEKKNNKEFYRQIKLTPENILEYKNNIKNLKLFFQGKKKSILISLKKDMAAFSKSKDFENAARVRNQIFALNHINDVALIKDDLISPSLTKEMNEERLLINSSLPSSLLVKERGNAIRIEAYDIAHMSGKDMVGVMVVLEDGEVKKSEYKKFIIKTQSGANDTGALEEILSRRLKHEEWRLPNIIVVDGGKAQINVAKKVLSLFMETLPDIKIVSVLKDERHKAKAIIGDENIIKKYKKQILLANSESHRFAITFHKQKRNKSFLNK